MKYRGIIFDLDGVLCYSDKYHYQAWKKLANELNLSFDEKMNESLRGVSRMESLEIILDYNHRKCDEKEKQQLAEKKNKFYVELINNMTQKDMAHGTIETLVRLRQVGIKTAIGSSSKNTKTILKKLELEKYFDAVCDGNCISRSKPDPEVFLKAAEQLHMSPENCLVVEDAIAGVEAACKGGFDSAAIGDAVNHPNATFYIDELGKLTLIVEI